MEFLKVYKYMGRADDGVTPILEVDETLLPLHQIRRIKKDSACHGWFVQAMTGGMFGEDFYTKLDLDAALVRVEWVYRI